MKRTPVRGRYIIWMCLLMLPSLASALAGLPPLPSQTYTPAQASQILESDSDAVEIAKVLKYAPSDPKVLELALAYVDKPVTKDLLSLRTRWEQQVRISLRAVLEATADSRPVNYSVEVFRYPFDDLAESLGKQNSAPAFELFKHLLESRFGFWMTTAEFAKGLETGSPAEKLFLDYLPTALFDWHTIESSSVGWPEQRVGILNFRTGEFKSFLTPAATEELRSQRRVSGQTLCETEDAVNALMNCHSDNAFNLLDSLIFEHDIFERENRLFWHTIPGGGSSPAYQLFENRYDPRVIALVDKLLRDDKVRQKNELIAQFFRPGSSEGGYELPGVYLLNRANPSVYPELQACITDAEKLDLDPEGARCLAYAKQELHDLQLMHPGAAAAAPAWQPAPLATSNFVSALPQLKLTPAEAVKVMQTSEDLAEVVAAMEIAAAEPSTRPAVAEFLKAPNDLQKYGQHWRKTLPNQEFAQPQREGGQGYLEAASEKYRKQISEAFAHFLADNQDTGVFPLLQAAQQGPFKYELGADYQFIKALKPGSVMEAYYLEYLENGLLFVQTVDYQNAKGEGIRGGLYDMRTGEFTSFLTPEQKAAFNPTSEFRHSLFGFDGIELLFEVNSPRADTLLKKIAASHLWEKPVEPANRLYLAPNFGGFAGSRYDRKIMDFLYTQLQNPAIANKTELIYLIAGPRWGYSDVSHDPAGAQLDTATFGTYPTMRAFITDAEKMQLHPYLRMSLAKLKAGLKWYESQRNLPYVRPEYPDYPRWGEKGKVSPATPLEPALALQVLQSSRNWSELTKAFATATTDATVRAVALKYLDNPPSLQEFCDYLVQTRWEKVTNFPENYIWEKYLSDELAGLLTYLGAQGTPESVEILRHLINSPLDGELYPPEQCLMDFAKAIPAGSPAESAFETYIKEAMLTEYQGPTLPVIWPIGPWQDVKQLVPDPRPSPPHLLQRYGFAALAAINTNQAYDTIRQIISADEFWSKYSVANIQALLSDGGEFRERPLESHVIAIYHQMLLDYRGSAEKRSIIAMTLPTSTKLNLPSQLKVVDASIFPQYLAFIDDAEKAVPENIKPSFTEQRKYIQAEIDRRAKAAAVPK